MVLCLQPFLCFVKKKSVVRWDLEGSISWGYLAHCSHTFFMSIHIEFSSSYSMLSQSLVTPTSMARLFINPEFCQSPLRRSCQLQLFWYLQQTVHLLYQLVFGPVTAHLMQWFLNHTLYYTHYIKCFANFVYRSFPAGIRTRFAGLASQFFTH